jgi:hypothetical protein
LRREGETYGMRLDSPAGAATDEASGAQTAGISGKVTILIVAAEERTCKSGKAARVR